MPGPQVLGSFHMRKTPLTTEETLLLWTERDLTAIAKRGELAPAFCVDEHLRQLDDIVMSGRCAIIVGESGVGKSSIVYELIRRIYLPNPDQEPHPPLQMMEAFKGRRILQISLRRRAAGLRQPHSQMGEEVLALVDALVATEEPIALYFRDMDLAFQFNLETHFENLAFKFDGPIIAEGLRSSIQNMLEYHPELDQHFVTLIVEEPGLQTMELILNQWSEHHTLETGIAIEDTALQHALYLSHRFLSRSRMPRKALDLIEQVAATTRSGSVTVADVINRFCDNHRVPRDLVDPDIHLDLEQLRAYFDKRVLGQDDAVSVLVDVIGLIKSGMSDSRRPFGVFLFVGPTGVGKTHLAQLLADFLFGDKERLIRVNMSDYSEPGKAEVLFGNPNGATPSTTRGVLAHRVSGHPFAVLLLDEFEKAHDSVHDRLLQLMDEGSFINGAGETVSCRSMIIIATSNAGAEVYRSEGFGFAPKELDRCAKDAELSRRLRETFRFEFLNRFDRIVHFHPLSQGDIRTIALREFDLITSRAGFAQRKLKLKVDESLIDWISVQGYHPDFGARFLRRTIERHIATAIATAIVRESPSPGSTLTATIRLNKVVSYVSSESSEPVLNPPLFVSQSIAVVPPIDSRDISILRNEANALLTLASQTFVDMLAKKAERKNLLGKMNQSSFWENRGKRADVLDRFRELEVFLRAESRAATAMERLQEELDTLEDSPSSRYRLTQRMESAEATLLDWTRRQEEKKRSALWMMLSCSEDTSGGTYLTKLLEMELAWCRRLGLDATVIAYSEDEYGVSRAWLAIEGIGAHSFLSMEEGIHRFTNAEGSGIHCECELWSVSQLATDNHRVRSSRQRHGAFTLQIDCKSLVRYGDEEFLVLGRRDANFSNLVAELDLRKALPSALVNVVARIYQYDEGASDPRTGVAIQRNKTILSGNLDRFLEAWRHIA